MSMFFNTLRWAWRDMRGNWRHFRLVILCLFLSLMSVTAVQVTGASVLKSIDEQANVILGGDWVLRQLYAPVGEEARTWLKSRGADLADTTEMRVMLINPQTKDASLVELKGVDQKYPLYGEMKIESSGQDFQSNLEKGIIIERSLGERLGVDIGNMLQLGDAQFKLVAWIGKEPDRAGGGRFGLAPRAFISNENLKTTMLEQPGSMVYYDLRLRWQKNKDLSVLKKDFLEAFPESDWRFTDTEKASPQIQRQVNNIVQFLTLIGLSALLIGGIGIANGMRAYFQTRLVTIAIFKSIGMKTNVIRGIYLWQILAIGILGTLLGVLIGCGLPMIVAPQIQSFLPFPVSVYVAPSAIAVPLSFGLLTTLIFSLWPLGEAERVSPLLLLRNMGIHNANPHWKVVAAIIPLTIILSALIILSSESQLFSLFFIGGAIACFGLFYLSGKIIACIAWKISGKAGFSNRLALQNLGRKGNTTAQTLVSLGIGLTVLISIALIERNLSATLSENLPKDAPAFFFLDIQPDQKPEFERLVSAFPTASKLIVMPNLRGRIASVNGVDAKDALIDKRESWLLSNERGFTYTDALPAHSEIMSGNWWPKDYKGPPLISVVDDVERGFGVKPGDKMKFLILGREIEATIANVREVNWTTFTVNFAITFAPGALEGAPHSWLATVVADPNQETALQRAVTEKFPNISMIRLSDTIETVSNLIGQMNLAVRIMALLALGTGLIVLIEALIASRSQRSYDTVILKVVGVPQNILKHIMLAEFALLSGVATLTAAMIGTVVSWGVLDLWMDLQWNFYPLLILQTVVISMVFIILTSWLVLKNMLKSPAIKYLRNE
ncbi:MAG: glycosyl transferase family 1 [Micavibrio aeruginosavorus]|uniref:Glycosyl transferase family 1 n=1 Tax=Micavibrio aeruginosavorus TaxID=349221 RepID=A0A2W5FSS0_9BACT|nr:MAG: glycosyl transferase family 1 [Micavibrio aeruginosavorus]